MTEKERVLAEWADGPTVKIHITQTAQELAVSRNAEGYGLVPSRFLAGGPRRVRGTAGFPLWLRDLEFTPRRAKAHG